MPIAAAIGAGITALGALAATSLSNSANANLDNANRQWQERMWHEANAYNTPVQQRQRLEAAGINPALAFQNGSTGVAASSPTPNQHTPADYSGLGAGISNAVAQYYQAQNVDANNELLKSQTEAVRIQNTTQLARDFANLYKTYVEAQKVGADTKWIEWQMDRSQAMFDAEYKRNYHEILALDAKTDLDKVNANYQLILNKFAPDQQRIITDNLSKQGVEIMSAVNKNNREAALAAAREALTSAQKSGVDIDNYTKDEMAEYVVDEQFYKSQNERYKASSEAKRYDEGELGYRLPAGGKKKNNPITRPRSGIR